jgi:hypothetical protein
MDWGKMSIDEWTVEMKKHDSMDIGRATKEELLSLSVVELSDKDEERVFKRAKELGMKF